MTGIQHLKSTHPTVRLDVAIDLFRWFTYLEGLDLPLFGAHLLSPCRLRFCDRLDTRLELVQLPPPRLHLFPHLIEPFSEPGFGFFTPFVEIQLDLAERLETRNQIVMKHTEVREWLSFGLAMLLLFQKYIG